MRKIVERKRGGPGTPSEEKSANWGLKASSVGGSSGVAGRNSDANKKKAKKNETRGPTFLALGLCLIGGVDSSQSEVVV